MYLIRVYPPLDKSSLHWFTQCCAKLLRLCAFIPSVVAPPLSSLQGYLDPEVYQLGLWSHKADVFSFGVVLLELATGKPAIVRDADGFNVNLRKVVVRDVDKGGIEAVLDPLLKGDKNQPSADHFLRFLYLGMRCTAREGDKRPSMRGVVDELERLSLGEEESVELPVCSQCLKDPKERQEEEEAAELWAMTRALNENL